MIVGGVCSGISAPAVAWQHLGWDWAFEAEIEKFPSAVLHYRRPDVPNRGDILKFQEWPHDSIDLLVGGTPCQSFSVAGLRKGLDDPRGNLALTFIALVARYKPRWVVWENVPGVLSSGGGRDFEAFIRGMAEVGYFGAWRVLDAQWFGVAQRRRRVFAVFCPGDWRPAAAVLFEPESLRGDSAPSREAREGFTHSLAPSLGASGRGFSRAGETRGQDPVIPSIAGCLNSAGGHAVPGNSIKDADQGYLIPSTGAVWHCLNAGAQDSGMGCATSAGVRRLAPRECERLQGFPDDHTRIPWRGKPAEQCPDGPRYKALGNSMAVPVVRWIGERIALYERAKGGI